MKSIILAVLVCVMPSITQTSHVLPYKVKWRTSEVVGNITIKSTLPLKNWKIKNITNIYDSSKNVFFNSFENLTCDYDKLGPLEIRVISADMLRDRRYFAMAMPYNFGRYFKLSNTLYIIHDMFNHPEYLAHELAHYFYDECKVDFKGDIKEHTKVYQFQDFYKKRSYYDGKKI